MKKNNFGYACFHFITCFPWIKQATKLQSYINMCKEIMYLHLFPPGLSPLGDHQFNYPVQYSYFVFHVEKNRGTIMQYNLLKGLPGRKEKEK